MHAASAIDVRPPTRLAAEIRPPGSKSITNRVLPLAAVARGTSSLTGCLVAEDTHLMRTALEKLGIVVEGIGTDLRVHGGGGPLARDFGAEVFVGTAGTVARFLTAMLAAGPHSTQVDGSPRMRERPMGPLLDALRRLGAQIEATEQPNALPLRVGPGPHGLRGGRLELARPTSSQFVSALLMAAPLMRTPLEIWLPDGTPARPYVEMTLQVMRGFGLSAGWDGENRLRAEPGIPRACEYAVEPDASAASYFLAAAAIYGGNVTIPALGSDSLQGDAAFVHVLGQMGATAQQSPTETRIHSAGPLVGIDVDLRSMPDMALTLAVVALHAKGPTRIRGVSILRHHESDRLAAGATELRKLGAKVQEHDDGLTIAPPAQVNAGVAIDTYLDHRMAMAFALAGNATIRDPKCVNKTYPGYFNELRNLGMVGPLS